MEKVIKMTEEELAKHVEDKVSEAKTAITAEVTAEVKEAITKEVTAEVKRNDNPFYATAKRTPDTQSDTKTHDTFYAVAMESFKTGEAMNKTAERMSKDTEYSGLEECFKRVQHAEEHRGKLEGKTVTMRSQEVIIPEVISNLVPELIEPNQIVRNIQGYNQVNLGKANYKINKEMTVPTASWIDYEGATVDASGYTFTPVELTPKKVQSKFLISKEALEASSVLTTQRIGGKLDKALAKAEDIAFLYGTGIGNMPLGIDNMILAANKIDSTATAYAAFYQEMYKVLRLIHKADDGDVDASAIRVITSSDVTDGMLGFMTPEGNIPFASIASGKFGNYPLIQSNHVHMDIGTGSGSTEAFFLNAADFVIGRAAAKVLKVITTGAVTDGGSVVTLEDKNLVALVMTETVDFGMVRNNTSGKLADIDLI